WTRGPGWAGILRGAHLPVLEMDEEHVERAGQNSRHIAARDGVSEQRLSLAQLVMRAARDGETDQEPLRCGRAVARPESPCFLPFRVFRGQAEFYVSRAPHIFSRF